MGVNLNLDFIELLKSSGLDTYILDLSPYIAKGVVFYATMYGLEAKDAASNTIVKVLSQKAVYKNLPVVAEGMLAALDKKFNLANSGITATVSETPPELKVLEVGPAMGLIQGVVKTPVKSGKKPIAFSDVNAYPVLDPHAPASPVYLRDATGLYRRVRGSDEGSIYFLLADFEKLKMAGRWKESKFSIRFEAQNMESYAKWMQEIGLKCSTKFHASIHVSVMSKYEVRKLVGAMIGAVPLDLVSPLPNAELIQDLGS